MTRPRLGVVCALLAALVCGCGGDSSDAPDAGPPSVEIGEGDVTFVPLVDGQDVYVIQGPQGGFHLLGSVRVSGLAPGDPDDLSNPDNPTTDFRVLRGGTRVDNPAATSYVQGLEAAAGGGHEMVGRLIILDILDDAEVDGDNVSFEVTVTDHRGLTASDARAVHIIPHPANL